MPPCMQTRKASGTAVKVISGGICLFRMEIFTLLLPSALTPMTTTWQDHQIAGTAWQRRPRLLQFIHRRISDEAEAQDLLQDVFAELVENYRLLKPVEQATVWPSRAAPRTASPTCTDESTQ